jgi:ABC-type lipoprotein release transport system permease subunit
MKKNHLKTKTAVVIFLITFSSIIYGQQDTMNDYEFEVNSEVSVSLPGEVYYENNEDAEFETLYNDDFELDLTCYKGGDYSYFPDLTEFINEIAEDYYKDFSDFIKKDVKPGVKSQYSITFDKEEEINIVFGVIQDSFSKKLYEFTLYCYNINSETAALIINGIKIN